MNVAIVAWQEVPAQREQPTSAPLERSAGVVLKPPAHSALRDSIRLLLGLYRAYHAPWVRTEHLTVRQLLHARGFVQQVGDPWCHGGGYTAGTGSVASDSHARSLCCSELPVETVEVV